MRYHPTHELCAKTLIEKIGKNIVIGIPLGIGKPIGLINALYRLAEKDNTIQLTIITGLTLARPVIHHALEKRLVEPILERLLGDYEDPLYEQARIRAALPPNITVLEFFLNPGNYLKNPVVQQNFISSNYTHVAQDVIRRGINVIAQQVASKHHRYSLSCNTDLFHPVVNYLKQCDHPIAIIGEVNHHLPFMPGKMAEVDDGLLTDVVETKHARSLFSLPREALSPADHLIGLYASALVKDDGCLQLGIGKLGNAVAAALMMRHQSNESYKKILFQLMLNQAMIREIGGVDRFETGIYASTEMLSDDYMHLYKADILKKRIMSDQDNSEKVIEACFFLGTQAFYDWLRSLPEKELNLIEMTSVLKTNDVLSNPAVLIKQRQPMRLINFTMMVTLGGAAISDGLMNLQEVSGVGGQFDFVNMAFKIPGARSIIACRATRQTKQGIQSNIVWEYPNITIPRHLRDIVVTEYGIADCRGKTDQEVIKALLNITDSRFQNTLLAKAKKAGKIQKNYVIPEIYQENTPQKIESIIREMKKSGYGQSYPFGSDLTAEEERLSHALLYLKNATIFQYIYKIIVSYFLVGQHRDQILQCLARMQLLHPKTFKEWIYQRLLIGVLTV